MSERYTYIRDKEWIYKDGEEFTQIDMCAYMNAEHIVKELNTLYEENEKLHNVIKNNEKIFCSLTDELTRLRAIAKSAYTVKLNLEHISKLLDHCPIWWEKE